MATKKETKKVVSTDDTMEEPMTKDYGAPQQAEASQAQPQQPEQVYIQIKDDLREALSSTIGELGYNREIGSPESHLQVFQIFEILDKTKGKYLTEDQANGLISMIAKAPYNVIAGVMKDIAENQGKFFVVKTRSQVEAEAEATENAKD